MSTAMMSDATPAEAPAEQSEDIDKKLDDLMNRMKAAEDKLADLEATKELAKVAAEVSKATKTKVEQVELKNA